LVLVVVFAGDLVWEIVRVNVFASKGGTSVRSVCVSTMCTTTLSAAKDSRAFIGLGVAPSAALLGVFLSLILARQQFALSSRPILGWSGDSTLVSHMLGSPAQWTVKVFNGGAGVARIARLRYRLKWNVSTGSGSSPPWLLRHEVIAALEARGLRKGRDFELWDLRAPHPLPATKSRDEDVELAAFQSEPLRRLARFDIEVRVEDIVGDVHERVLDLLEPLRHDEQHGGAG
jgi:hypothetical protein